MATDLKPSASQYSFDSGESEDNDSQYMEYENYDGPDEQSPSEPEETEAEQLLRQADEDMANSDSGEVVLNIEVPIIDNDKTRQFSTPRQVQPIQIASPPQMSPVKRRDKPPTRKRLVLEKPETAAAQRTTLCKRRKTLFSKGYELWRRCPEVEVFVMVKSTNRNGKTSVQYSGSDKLVHEYELEGIKRDSGSKQTLVDLYVGQQDQLSDSIHIDEATMPVPEYMRSSLPKQLQAYKPIDNSPSNKKITGKRTVNSPAKAGPKPVKKALVVADKQGQGTEPPKGNGSVAPKKGQGKGVPKAKGNRVKGVVQKKGQGKGLPTVICNGSVAPKKGQGKDLPKKTTELIESSSTLGESETSEDLLGQWVAVAYKNSFHIGKVSSMSSSAVHVKFLERRGSEFQWPIRANEEDVKLIYLFCKKVDMVISPRSTCVVYTCPSLQEIQKGYTVFKRQNKKIL